MLFKRFTSLQLCFIFSSMMIFSCSKNPVTGKRDFMLMSEKREIAIGKQNDPSIVASFGLYQDDKLQKFINDKGQSMAKISHRPHLDYEFKILDSPVVNAFAVPGGYVYFTRGILAHFNNEAEFAGVLGHEIGHVTARHSAKQQSKSILAQVGLMAGMIFSPQFRQFGQQAQQSLGLLFLKFGRDAESQSDRLGVEYSCKIGYDSKEMAGFFKTLNRLSSKGGEEIPTFLSTHPHPLDRFEKVESMTREVQSKNPNLKYRINRDQYLRRIDGLIYGEDPRQGYVEKDVFYHPELKFQYPVPRNWRTVNSPAQVQHAPEANNALLQLSVSQAKTAREAASKFISENQLQQKSSDQTKTNGMTTVIAGATQAGQNGQAGLEIIAYFYEYNQLVYQLIGVAAAPDFGQYRNTFLNSMRKFNRLNDASKIDVYPEMIKIKTASKSARLSELLKENKIATKRHEELAVLNGMELNDRVEKGTLYKIVAKSR